MIFSSSIYNRVEYFISNSGFKLDKHEIITTMKRWNMPNNRICISINNNDWQGLLIKLICNVHCPAWNVCIVIMVILICTGQCIHVLTLHFYKRLLIYWHHTPYRSISHPALSLPKLSSSKSPLFSPIK